MPESPFRSFYQEVTPTTSSLCHHLNIEVFALAFHIKQLHIHFVIVDVIVGEGIFSEESIITNK